MLFLKGAIDMSGNKVLVCLSFPLLICITVNTPNKVGGMWCLFIVYSLVILLFGNYMKVFATNKDVYGHVDQVKKNTYIAT